METNRRSFLASAGALAAIPGVVVAGQTTPRATKPATYVLVHGGGHGGWCYKRVTERLRKAGHVVYAPSLTGLGERSHLLNPSINLDTHIDDIVNLLKWEELTNVVIVGHSYGGMVITGVADRAASRIGHLVYLDAAIPKNGDSLAANPAVKQEYARVKKINDTEVFLFPETDTINRHYGVTDPKDVAWMKTLLTPHPWKCFSQPIALANEAAIARIPRTIITRPLKSGTAPRSASGEPTPTRRKDGAWEIDTGHDMMITTPQAVTDILLTLA